ncbi:MAG: 50S ribosomal protein L5 [Candidatus Hydrogenedentes bacterium]|nr:50S ribosomal protein L5 [Candidatus Hydrogenedentota bacterium]
MSARLREQYKQEIRTSLQSQYAYRNVMEVPQLDKVVINMGVGAAVGDPRLLESAVADLAALSGQKPVIRKARKSISNFKLREGVKIGCTVTLRGERMYEFMDRLFTIAMPRIRDFRGVSNKGFDKQGNYTMGLREQTIFPECSQDDAAKVRGMNISFVLKRETPKDQSRELLRQLGMPFAK